MIYFDSKPRLTINSNSHFHNAPQGGGIFIQSCSIIRTNSLDFPLHDPIINELSVRAGIAPCRFYEATQQDPHWSKPTKRPET